MCTIFETRRGFVLSSDMLHNGGFALQEMMRDFERVQNQYGGELEIYFSKDFRRTGGFVICLPPEQDAESRFDDTEYLRDYFEADPRMVCLAKMT